MGFCSHEDRGVGYAVGQLCQGVPRTRCNEKNIQVALRTNRFGILQFQNGGIAGQVGNVADKLRGISKRESVVCTFVEIMG